MTQAKKSDPTPAPAQADQAQRQQFEQELGQLERQHEAGAPAGAQAGLPGPRRIWAAILAALKNPAVRAAVLAAWEALSGTEENPTPQPPAPPPEPAS
jgi:hypothetical protein